LERALEGIAASGLKFVELGAIPGHTEHVSPENMLSKDVNALKKLLSDNGLTATSISGHCDMAKKDGLALFMKRLELAESMSIKYINTAKGSVDSKESEEAFYANMREAANYNKELIICLETHGGLLGTSAIAKKTLEVIGCENVKINYDPANLIFFNDKRPEDDITDAVTLIGHFHIKDKLEGPGVWNFPEIGTGNIDFSKLFSVLKDAGYDGPLSFELEFDGNPSATPEFVDNALKNSANYVKSVAASIGW